MHIKKWSLLLINIFGGVAVLGSYVQGILTHSHAAETLWGGVSVNIRPFYTAGMFLAAAGYFAFTYFILFRIIPGEVRVFQRFGFDIFNILYAVILLPSALWMPLTFLAVEQSSLSLLWTVRLILAIVGLASIGLLVSILNVEPRQPLWAHRLAIAGSAAFCIQTVILDAIVWGAFF